MHDIDHRSNYRRLTELQDYVKQNAPPYMYPRAIEFSTELPKTINGKILRSELRRLAASA